jgi:hypothetical protein
MANDYLDKQKQKNSLSKKEISNYYDNNQSFDKPLNSNINFNFANIQTKLKVSQPGDIYEQEAEKISELVSGISSKYKDDNVLSNFNSDTEQEKINSHELKNRLEDKESNSINLNGLEIGGGEHLDPFVRNTMESSFGFNFSKVRIHRNQEADNIAKYMGSNAFTFNQHIVFGSERYSPTTSQGKKLIAHELSKFTK